MYTLFVCGAPHNSKGFEYRVIEGSPLPEGIGQYIDIYDADKMKEGRSYVIQKLMISKKEYSLIAEYIRINPSDQKSSRGSYIAVGILTDEVISLHTAIDYLCIIESMHASLRIMRNERNAFSKNFSMKDELVNINYDYNYIPALADIAKNVSNQENTKKIVFNDLIHNNKIPNIPDDALENEFNELKRKIEQYMDVLHDEKEAHKLTRVEYEKDILELNKEISILNNALEAVNNTLNMRNTKISSLEDKVYSLNKDNNSLKINNSTFENKGLSLEEYSSVDKMPKVDSPNETNYKGKNYKPPSKQNHSSTTIQTGFSGSKKKKSNYSNIVIMILAAILLIIVAYFGYGLLNKAEITNKVSKQAEINDDNSSSNLLSHEDSGNIQKENKKPNEKLELEDQNVAKYNKKSEDTKASKQQIKSKEPSTMDKIKEKMKKNKDVIKI